MVHTSQGFGSTKTLLLEHPETTAVVPSENQADKTTKDFGLPPNKLHICAIHKSKFYTDDTGRFPVRSRSGNQYVMVAYHSSDVILVAPFKTRKYQHRLAVYNSIMQSLNNRGLNTYLKIL